MVKAMTFMVQKIDKPRRVSVEWAWEREGEREVDPLSSLRSSRMAAAIWHPRQQ
jgi:hypothetical protein